MLFLLQALFLLNIDLCRYIFWGSKEEACPGSELETLAFRPLQKFYLTTLFYNYTGIVYLMMLLFSNVSKDIIMEHYILPAHCVIQIEVDLIHFVLGFHLNQEILIIKNCID